MNTSYPNPPIYNDCIFLEDNNQCAHGGSCEEEWDCCLSYISQKDIEQGDL